MCKQAYVMWEIVFSKLAITKSPIPYDPYNLFYSITLMLLPSRSESHACLLPWTGGCYGLKCVPTKSYAEALTCHGIVFKMGLLRVRFKWDHEGEASWWSLWSYLERYQRGTLSCSLFHIVRRQIPTMLAPWSWSSSLQSCEKINLCHLSHPIFGIVL